MSNSFAVALDNFYRFSLSSKVTAVLGILSSTYLLQFEISREGMSNHYHESARGFLRGSELFFDRIFERCVESPLGIANATDDSNGELHFPGSGNTLGYS